MLILKIYTANKKGGGLDASEKEKWGASYERTKSKKQQRDKKCIFKLIYNECENIWWEKHQEFS